MKFHTCRPSTRTFRHLRLPAALLLALLSTAAWAGNSCELIDADTDTEYNGESGSGGDAALACGFDNQISGDNGTVVGNNNVAYDGATAVGYDNDSRLANSSAFGYSNVAYDGGTSVGYDNDARAPGSTALGYSNIANDGSTAVGNDNDARFGTSNAFGSGNTAYESSTAIGHNNYAGQLFNDENGNGVEDAGEVARFTSAVGYGNRAVGNASAAFGFSNLAVGEYSAAMGVAGSASGTGASAIGGGGFEIDLENFPVPVEGGRATVQISGREIGFLWKDVNEPLSLLNIASIDGKLVTIDPVNEIYRWGDRDVTVEELSALYSSAIYGGAIALGEHATAVGSRSTAFGDRSLAVGTHAFADGDSNVAIGADAVANGARSVALGTGSLADRADSVSIGSVGNERQVINVAAATQGTDAVNLVQLSPVATAFGGGASYAGGTFAAPTYVIQGLDYHDVGAAFGAVDGRITDLYSRITDAGGVQGPSGPQGPTGPQGPEGPAGGGPRSVVYDQDAGDTLTLKGANGTTISNVAEGVAATDAVNKGQMDAGDAATLQSSKTYTDTTATQTLTSANAYTDAKFASWESSLGDFRSDIEHRFSQQDRRIDRQGAMGSAMLNMAINAAGSQSPRGRIAVGAGFQSSEKALSIGYGKRIGTRGSFSLGGAFSGGEKSAGVGFGLDL